MKKNINQNLQIGFGISLVLLIISSIASYISITNLLESADLVDHSNLVVQQLEDVISTMKDAETGQRGYLLTSRRAFLEPYNGAYERALKLTDTVKDLTKDNPEQQKNIAEVKNILLSRLNIHAVIIAKKDAGKVVTVDDLLEGKLAMDALRTAIKRAEQTEINLLKTRTASLKKLTSSTPIIIIIATLLAISFSAFSFIKVTADMRERARLLAGLEEKDRIMSRRINIIQHIAEQISAGDYGIRVNDHEKDDLGGLANSLNRMAATLADSFQKLTNNEWIQTGAARLNDQMIGEKDVDVLAHNILEFIVTYTNSQMGALYVLENEVLVLKSGHALDQEAPSVIRLGEGIVGQTAIDNKAIWLKNIADEAIVISHAVGQLRPRDILVVPIEHERKVKAVLELASVNPYPDRKLEFLKDVSGGIGVAFESAYNRKKLQELLEETQAQSEELQMQHHELGIINTALEAHTQKLQASEEELRAQQEELQQSYQELTERNRLIQEQNDEIHQKAVELEQTTRYKSEFMANMSHELRTPLNSILLLSRYLAENNEKNLTSEQIESASVILNSGHGLLNLIDELLDLSKIEAGKMELEYQQFPVNYIVGSLQALFQPIAKEKRLDLIIENHLEENFIIETDRMRLEQILKNLLSNAFKFTPHGQVKLTVQINAKNAGLMDWSVVDTGIGIPADKQELVFEAFQQADGSTKRRYGGTGLGLSISRELARLLGGHIRLISELDKGSAFTLTIPFQRPQMIAASVETVNVNASSSIAVPIVKESKYIVPVIPEDVPDDRHSIKSGDKIVLIVEDDTVFATTLLKFSRQNGYKGIVAVRGDDGVSLAKEYLPTAILLDIHLPIKDGWQVMEELKSDPVTRHIPVHIMSSLEARHESRMRGAVDFINKPVAAEQIKQMFHKLEEVWNKHPKKILIVEENAYHAHALAYFLETFRITSAVSKGVAESIEALQNKAVDCVIMDMGVPGQHGYEMLESIKQNPGLEDLPVIVFTGKQLSASEESRIRRYADTIVVKTAHSYQRILDEVTLFLHLVSEKDWDTNPLHKSLHLTEILKDKTVLIADDDVKNIFSLTKSLEKYGMVVLSATDGKEALEQLEQHPETDIVLMDMMMPEMDGYESIHRIRRDLQLRGLPIIAVTAKAMLGDREKCIEAGASDYISKPVDIDQLTSLLRVWLFNA